MTQGEYTLTITPIEREILRLKLKNYGRHVIRIILEKRGFGELSDRDVKKLIDVLMLRLEQVN